MKVFGITMLISLLAIAVVVGVGVGGSFLGKTIGYEGGYSDGYDIGYTLGWDSGYGGGWQEGYNTGWSEGYAEPRPLRLFESLGELRSWILQDDTDSLVYITDTWDCDDFAMRLSKNATDDGYFIGLYVDNVASHVKNFARIEGKTDVIYLIEPQNDRIKPLQVD